MSASTASQNALSPTLSRLAPPAYDRPRRSVTRGAATRPATTGHGLPQAASARTSRYGTLAVVDRASGPVPRTARPAAGPAAGRSAASATRRRGRAVRTASAVHVRLTRRGRLLVLLALVGVLFAAFSLGRAASQAAPPVEPAAAVTSSAVVTEQVTVQSGESLWTVARRIAPDNDPRDVVAQIRRLNDLSTAQLRPGQQLLLPVAA